MEQTVVMINLSELVEEMKFRKAIKSVSTYQLYEEYLDVMIAITERDMEEDPDFPK